MRKCLPHASHVLPVVVPDAEPVEAPADVRPASAELASPAVATASWSRLTTAEPSVRGRFVRRGVGIGGRRV